ncbi:hypothetical protein ACE10W_37115 [Bradyrhizobium sp. B025]|uniref:hypothetical protein n=1 Tax=Bradyrhizobium sp. B025 TaxID=3344829 RepID=UPI0035D47EE4
MSLTRDQLVRLKLEVTGHAVYASRISLVLALRLVGHPADTSAVLHEIGSLEGLRPATRAKPPQQFKHAPLAPLWHKHFFSPRHLLRNIGERWNLARGAGNRDLDVALSEIAAQHGDDPAKWPSVLVHRLNVGGLEERAHAQRLTGDWIIFAKRDGENYYLDLATHEEAEGPANSERLMQKLQAGCQSEFPFLF